MAGHIVLTGDGHVTVMWKGGFRRGDQCHCWSQRTVRCAAPPPGGVLLAVGCFHPSLGDGARHTQLTHSWHTADTLLTHSWHTADTLLTHSWHTADTLHSSCCCCCCCDQGGPRTRLCCWVARTLNHSQSRTSCSAPHTSSEGAHLNTMTSFTSITCSFDGCCEIRLWDTSARCTLPF
jgi:hypothetical protein